MVEKQNIEENLSETKEDSKSLSPVSLLFEGELETIDSFEEKIRKLLAHMRDSLARDQNPAMREFWEARKLCLPLFKQSLNAKSRFQFWEEYMELTKEARRLKEMLDVDASFACEQIELAIQALKNDQEKFVELSAQIPDLEIPETCQTLLRKKLMYNSWYKELQLLGTFAARVNSLRDEILKTQMRLRFKNRLFDQLMKVGDDVFPRRKELINQVSESFAADVDVFIEKEFKSSKALPFVLKEEIKALQSFAKHLTLNISTFANTRQKLSECWDKLREQEKEYKKELAVKKEIYRKNFDEALKKIEEFSAKCLEEKISENAINEQQKIILDWMRTVELGRDEVKALKAKLTQAKKPFLEQLQENQLKQKNQLETAEKEKRIKAEEVLKEIQALSNSNSPSEDQDLSEKYASFCKQMGELSLSENEKMTFKAHLRDLMERILDQKQKALLSAKSIVIDDIYQLLNERKQMRQELKQELEGYRKAIGRSSLDFVQSLLLNQLSDSGKQLLDKVDNAIIEIDEKIFDLRK